MTVAVFYTNRFRPLDSLTWKNDPDRPLFMESHSLNKKSENTFLNITFYDNIIIEKMNRIARRI